MQSLRTRQLRADLSFDGSTYTSSKPWAFPAESTLGGLTLADAVHAHVDAYVYCDVGRAAENYTETGSRISPYRGLSAAVTAKLTNANTDFVIFLLAPGDYVGTIAIDQQNRNQGFAIVGSGRESCFIKGHTGTFDATVGNVLYFRDFLDITVRDCTITNGAYGLYTRDTHAVTIENCNFNFLGTDGYDHDFATSDATLTAHWAARGTAGAHRSDGGAMRIRQSTDVRISNCAVFATLRGYRCQDCLKGQITNCSAEFCLESAYYLASNTYTGDINYGCWNFQITGCKATDIFHQPFLVIGGAYNTIQGCTAHRCANGGVVAWHTQDLKVIANTFDECNLLGYRGVGGLGDSYGQIFQQNKEDITSTGGYALTCLNNVFTRCGQGREAAVYTFFFAEAWVASASSFRVIIDGNASDGAVAVKNNTSVPLVSTAYPPAAAGGLSGAAVNRVMVTDGTGDASASTVTTTTLAYLDVTESIDTSLQNRAKTNEATTFSDNVTVNGFVYIANNAGNDALFQMSKQGGYSVAKIEHRGSHVRIKLSSAKYHLHADGRHQFAGEIVQVPTSNSVPAPNAANSKGGFYLDTSVSPGVMKYHNGVSWVEIATV